MAFRSQDEIKKAKTMAYVNILEQVKSEVSNIAWLKPADAAEIGVVFNVMSIKPGNSQFGPQWVCEISIRWDTVDEEEYDLGFEHDQRVFMTFPGGPTRDDIMKKLISMGHTRLFNCIVQLIDTGKGNPYLDLAMLNPDDDRWEEPPTEPKRIGASKPAGVTRRKSGTKLVTGSNLTRRNLSEDDDPFLVGGDIDELP